MAAPVGLKNSNYDLQFIRDLYDKMFPNAKDYIKFLREEINQCHYEKSNLLFNNLYKLSLVTSFCKFSDVFGLKISVMSGTC